MACSSGCNFCSASGGGGHSGGCCGGRACVAREEDMTPEGITVSEAFHRALSELRGKEERNEQFIIETAERAAKDEEERIRLRAKDQAREMAFAKRIEARRIERDKRIRERARGPKVEHVKPGEVVTEKKKVRLY